MVRVRLKRTGARNAACFRVVVMDQGKIALKGTPKEVFAQVDRMKELHLDVPQVTLLAHELRKAGIPLPEVILTGEELADALTGAGAQPDEEVSDGN